ncbi:MAG: PEP-CTERM sorting domain-containing protein [Paludisphaera borealis]|uniref:PEP-CTERM sorting domain-containing protein n=1 Tax=Paludisphaera borealis TaxID=1387353 RepID=UPI00285058B3|nr:PEP-CTERM sorting domain-containing protein [Paludisphaera borealis]MDR3619712.1 PEP-CTERM sorting domain-containing protein [Paludisphaera borealis]
MIKLHRALMAGALFVLAAVPAQAASGIAGSLGLNGVNVTSTSADLSLPNVVVSSTNSITLSAGTGDFAGVPNLTTFGATTVDVANLTSFTLTNAVWGSFAATSGVVVGTPTSGFLNIYLLGTFTPVSGPAAGPASVQITITSAGGSVSEAITINAPPTSTPEPASIAMAGIGLAAAGLVRVLRKRSA